MAWAFVRYRSRTRFGGESEARAAGLGAGAPTTPGAGVSQLALGQPELRGPGSEVSRLSRAALLCPA